MYMCAAVDRCELTGQETGGPRQVVDLSNEDVVFRGLLFPPVTSRRWQTGASATHTTSRSLWYLNVVYKKGAGAAGAAPDRLIDHSMLFTAREPALTHDGIDAATATAVWMNGLPDVSITAAATFPSLSLIFRRERELLDAGAFDHFMILSQHGNHAPNHQSLLCVCGSSRTPAESFFIDISSSLPFLHFFWCLVATRKKRHEMERFWQTCRIRDDKNIYSRARNKKREREKLRHRREATEAGWKEGENINYAGHVAMGWSARAKASNRGRRSETFHPIRTGPPKRRDGGGRESMPISFSISFASHTTEPCTEAGRPVKSSDVPAQQHRPENDWRFFFSSSSSSHLLKSPKLQKRRRNAKKEIKRR